MSASLATVSPPDFELISDDVATKHMAEKHIPGLSVAIVQNGDLVFAKGYGMSSVEFDIAATADTVYPISSVSRTFAGLLAVRLQDQGLLDLDASISAFGIDLPADKQAISVRHLLQHTHGLEDFYHSDDYVADAGKSMDAIPCCTSGLTMTSSVTSSAFHRGSMRRAD
jgi:CubicO group peptidase (beta-lactamase class C family)